MHEFSTGDTALFEGPANDLVGKTYTIDPVACEGCGVCPQFCPVDAIEFKDVVNGQWFISQTRFGPMVHARLGIAQQNCGKLVSVIRKQAAQKIKVSRQTFGRILESAHKKITDALVNAKALAIEGGSFELDAAAKIPEPPHRFRRGFGGRGGRRRGRGHNPQT